MRYFLISYIFKWVPPIMGEKYTHSYADISFEADTFPSRKEIIEFIRTQVVKQPVDVTISNIYEFKSREDYILYSGK